MCSEEHADLQTDLADLEAKENQIDDLIRNAKLQIKLLTEDKQYAYVSYQVGFVYLLSTILRFAIPVVDLNPDPVDPKLIGITDPVPVPDLDPSYLSKI